MAPLDGVVRKPSWKKCPLSSDLGGNKNHMKLGVGTDLKYPGTEGTKREGEGDFRLTMN